RRLKRSAKRRQARMRSPRSSLLTAGAVTARANGWVSNRISAFLIPSAGAALLFLHGDCLLPPGATQLIARALSDKSVAGGCFLIGFAERRPPSLGLIARGINARTIVTRTGTGDQAIFVRQEVYEAVGGFRPWPLFEDVDIVARIRRRGKFVVLRSAVTISARRWIAHGPWRTTFLMYALRVGYWLGIPPARLKQWFVDVRR